MLKRNSLFMKITVLTLSGVLFVSLLTMWASSAISERILLELFVKNGKANIKNLEQELLDYHNHIVNMMIRINNSEAFKNYLTKPAKTTLEQIELIMDLGEYMDIYKDYFNSDNTHFIVSALPGQEGRHYSSNALKWDKLSPEIILQYMTEDGEIPNRVRYHSNPLLFTDSVPYDTFIVATKPLVEGKTGEIYGYAAIVFDEANIYQNYSSYVSEGISIDMISADGTILSSSNRTQVSKQDPKLLSVAANAYGMEDHVLADRENNITWISYYLPELNAYLVETIDQETAFAGIYDISWMIARAVGVVLLITLVFVYAASKRITRPLNQLVRTMQHSKGNSLILHPLEERGSYETKVLTAAYNKLIKEIESYMDKLIEEQQERRKADLNALQMQINPHFLYNTLSSIKYMARMHRTEQVDQTIDSLISVLQRTLGSTEDHITMKEEIETLRHYITINQMRYGDRIRVHEQIADDCLELYVPKLIIQPIVENSFFHAFPGDRKGNIHLFVRRQAERLIIEVMDDGIGMPKEQLTEPLPKKRRGLSGIGIANVNSRIQLLYGSQYGVRIDSEPGFGTVVTMSLPVIEKREDAADRRTRLHSPP